MYIKKTIPDLLNSQILITFAISGVGFVLKLSNY